LGYQIEKNEIGGECSMYGESRDAYRVLAGKMKERDHFEDPGRLWEDNIKVDLQQLGWGMEWLDLARDRDGWLALVNAVRKFSIP
jgi:hypothetical protein